MAPQSIGTADCLGRYSIPVLESVPVTLIIGTILGFLSGLGVGGGSLLILWLTLVEGYSAPAARGINLLFFLPSAAISIIFRWKQGSIPLQKILPAIVAGCIALQFSVLHVDHSLSTVHIIPLLNSIVIRLNYEMEMSES